MACYYMSVYVGRVKLSSMQVDQDDPMKSLLGWSHVDHARAYFTPISILKRLNKITVAFFSSRVAMRSHTHTQRKHTHRNKWEVCLKELAATASEQPQARQGAAHKYTSLASTG